ncbi:DUF7282 domain-containing protein [Halobacterium zhouii]|uniref:DUF7282 domain-containing protein n=1 Tax=Halobacterium zhouii TaxID=2902624 RepID=UPI001E2F567F|nr:hypothetical protein [Halobacterium zhouii]
MSSTRYFAVALVTLLTIASFTASGAAMAGADRGQHSVARSSPSTCIGSTPSSVEDGNISMSVFTGPTGTYADLQNASAVNDARAAGRLVPTTTGTEDSDSVVAMGDVAVVRIGLDGSATSLLDRLTAQDEGSPTANFRALVQERGIEVEFEGPSACPPTLALNESIEQGAIRAVPDDQRDTLYLVFDTDRFLVDPPGTDSEPTATSWKLGRNHLDVRLKTTSGLVSASTTWQLWDRGVELETDVHELVRVGVANASLDGRTVAAPGNTLTVRLYSLDSSVTRTVSATVDGSREFTAPVELPRGVYTVNVLSAYKGNYSVNVSNAYDGDTLVVAGNATGALLGFADHGLHEETLHGLSTTTTDGGFVVVQNESGSTVAVSNHFTSGGHAPNLRLSNPLRTNQTLTATVYRDTNGNGAFDPDVDEPYRVDSEPVRASTNVTIDQTHRTTSAPEPSTSTLDATTDVNDQTTPTDSETPTDSTTDETGASTPGFGALTVLAALAALSGLAVWRP